MTRAIDMNKIQSDVDTVWNMDDQEVYRLLGLAQMGTKSVTLAKKSMSSVMSAAANTNAKEAMASISGSLEVGGISYFEELWGNIKGIICQIYNDKLQIEGKDLAAYLVAALVSAVSISSALAVLVITIAVKRGLDKMCEQGN